MTATLIQRILVISISVFIALILTVFPLTDSLRSWRPDWVLLVLIYWCMALPWRMGMLSAGLVGLLMDVLHGSLLGMHALAMMPVIYVVQKFHLQLRAYPVWQQSFAILFFLIMYRLPIFWLHGMLNNGKPVFGWQEIIAGTLVWPWLFAMLRRMRRLHKLD